MRLSKQLRPENILILDKISDKKELFGMMIEKLAQTSAIKDSGLTVDEISQAVWLREETATTGTGDGYAFPHARLHGLQEIAICLVVLRNGVDYGSIDNKPADVICMSLSPENNPTISLKVMAQMVRLFANPESSKAIRSAADAEAVYKIVKEANLSLDIAITAREIMRKPILTVYTDTPLRDVTHQMNRLHLNYVAVQEKGGKIAGEISCELLFQVGLPDFFTQLKSVSFIDEFDPFEKYFDQEIKATAGDVMRKDPSIMPPTATLLEIVFQLAVKHQPAVYVEENGVLVGVIDQGAVLDQIINV